MSGRATWLCYTDGSAKSGPGAPGGWGFVVRPPSRIDAAPIEGYGKATGTIAKVMEYRAVAEAVAVLPAGAEAIVFCDNQSLVENLAKRLDGWRSNGFAKVDPTIVESVRKIAAAIDEKDLTVEWRWVRGHNRNAGNERADALAAQGTREAKEDLRR